jgi:predicted acetyltransferase
MALNGFGDDEYDDIKAAPQNYIDKICDPGPRTVTLKDGSVFMLYSHEILWAMKGDRFIGSVAMRYEGDADMMQYYCGHVGMGVRPGLLCKGYGPKIGQSLLKASGQRAMDFGLNSIYVTCSPGNRPSRRLIEFFGGQKLYEFDDIYGEGPNLVYQVDLEALASP